MNEQQLIAKYGNDIVKHTVYEDLVGMDEIDVADILRSDLVAEGEVVVRESPDGSVMTSRGNCYEYISDDYSDASTGYQNAYCGGEFIQV